MGNTRKDAQKVMKKYINDIYKIGQKVCDEGTLYCKKTKHHKIRFSYKGKPFYQMFPLTCGLETLKGVRTEIRRQLISLGLTEEARKYFV